jgi:hypothetical protein
VRVNGTYVDGSHVNGSEAAPQIAVVPETAAAAIPDAAVLVASQLNRYSQAATAPPAQAHDEERLAEQIAVARTEAEPAPAAASALGLFDEALSKMLGSSALDQTPATIPTF